MLFSSTIFLFLFLPLTLTGYFLLRGVHARNIFLLSASLLFYAWGEVFYLLVMLLSIFWNKSFGWRIEDATSSKRKKLLWIGVGGNLVLLGFFKYANFINENINLLLALIDAGPYNIKPIHLPLGISFFTFQAITYLVDIYRAQVTAQRKTLEVALYISLFPQLVAGPIVRYKSIATELVQRTTRIDDFAYGLRRFIIGLGKKVLLANYLGATADEFFAIPPDIMTTSDAWLGIACYTLQIYFDFSGYSDMAIGLGRIFGFHFPENFNYPYISRSVQEFWRRWHITLSTWFRDYLYIPLGGNRGSHWQTYRNLFIVFFLCGLWHGASWNFIVWGLWHGLFLIIERMGLLRLIETLPRLMQHIYLLLVIMIGWVFFRANDLGDALQDLWIMSGGNGTLSHLSHLSLFYDVTTTVILVIGTFAALPWIKLIQRQLQSSNAFICFTIGLSRDLLLFLMLVASVISIAAGTYNPFIYFRF